LSITSLQLLLAPAGKSVANTGNSFENSITAIPVVHGQITSAEIAAGLSSWRATGPALPALGGDKIGKNEAVALKTGTDDLAVKVDKNDYKLTCKTYKKC
jgi:hypothetical protein